MSRQASTGGRGSRFMHRVMAVMFWLPVPVLPALLVSGDLGWAWWHVALVVLFSLFLGFASWWDAGDEKQDTERLRAAGRRAVAEILVIELEDVHDGSTEMAVLRLRIAGAEVPPFEAWYRTPGQPEFKVGARFHATVDPADNLVTLVPL
ncbi:hypothetical protein [Amycolatopsis sp. NPDC059657]|uniref:hypothetical protein n=1 Tax=Amycolatopsis sp. NPDC059657 TaxID=3346899 RepID=UPI00366E3A89